MAFQNSIVIPGHGTTYNYLRIDGFLKLSQRCRDMILHVRIHQSQATAALADADGFLLAEVRFTTTAFDRFFSKVALKAAGNDVYAQGYLAIKALTAAQQVEASDKAAVDTYNAALALYNAQSIAFKAVSTGTAPVAPTPPVPALVPNSDAWWLTKTAFANGILVGTAGFVGALDV